MKTNQELVEALRNMYSFLGGNGCMQCSTNSKEQYFRCGFSASNTTLTNAIINAGTRQGKKVICEYSNAIVNIEVKF